MCNPVSGHVISLDLSCNNLKGVLHPNSTIFQLNNLQQLNLAFNDFSGSLMHAEIGNLVSLTHLNLSNTGISGNIPYTISYLSKLVSLDLSNNGYMSLKLDPFTWKKLIHNATNLRELHLEDVNMTSIRESSLLLLKNLSSSLVSLNLASTELQGNLSSDLFYLPNLKVLDLSYNYYLGGQLPKTNWTSPLRYLDLSSTTLSGEIPYSIGQLKYLTQLVLSYCNFDGLVPPSLWNLTKLKYLDLSYNNLEGEISNVFGPLPTSCIKNFQGMKNLNVTQTGLQYMMGNYKNYNESVVVIMKGFFMNLTRILTSFTTIDLSNNMFEGEIPEVIGELNSLIGLNLSNNGITGTIPKSLGNLINLEWLDLSRNHLTGEIPESLSNLTFLCFLNLSQNQLEGIIPTGKQFDTFGNVSYEGNAMLCGLPLSKSCKNDKYQLPQSTSNDEEETGFGFGWKSVAIGYGCGAVFGVLLGYNVFLTGKPRCLATFIENMFRIRLKRTHYRAGANHRGIN
ncbi:receptor-like protein 35 [Cicer arietinum]